jgi:hypothetical protein
MKETKDAYQNMLTFTLFLSYSYHSSEITAVDRDIIANSSKCSSSFLGSTAELGPWPPPQNPAEFLGGFSTIFFFTG